MPEGTPATGDLVVDAALRDLAVVDPDPRPTPRDGAGHPASERDPRTHGERVREQFFPVHGRCGQQDRVGPAGDDVGQVDAVEVVARTTAERDLPAAVRLGEFGDGEAAQVLHVGPYAEEAPTVDALHAFVTASGRELAGRHHEIYLSDPRRTAPERLRTIIRQPVAPLVPA